jgi:hypothetical protein
MSSDMNANLLAFGKWLEQSAAGLMVRESLWGFQIVVAIHIVGLAFSIGLLVWFDFRLLGLGVRPSRVSDVYRQLIRWAGVGFVSMFVTGGLLFTGFATSAMANPFFRTKLALIAVAGANALVYHLVTERSGAAWDDHDRPPRAARIAGFVSIVAWFLVILCGRMMSYTMF